MKRLASEAQLRRRAFDIIPQLPEDPELAVQILEFTRRLTEFDTALPREHRHLAADLSFALPEDKQEALRVLEYAMKLWRDNLAPGVIEDFIADDGDRNGRLRLVRER